MPPRKILAIKLRALGDTVLMTAPLQELRRAYPGAEIHAVTLSQWAPLLEGHPAVDRIWPFERHRETAARAKAVARLALKLRKERFDVAVNFHASPSSSTLAFASGAPVRAIHFHGHRDRNRYSTVEIAGKGVLKPVIERDMDTVRALGIEVPAGRLPSLPLNPIESDQGWDRLERLRLQAPVLALGLGASRPTKSWPLDRFAALAVAWRQQTGGGVLALISGPEAPLAHDFLKSVDDLINTTVEDADERAPLRTGIAAESGLPLRQMAAVLRHCALLCGNDSGPRHVAVAVETPTVTLFGPEHPFEWHPYDRDAHPYLYVENLACRKDADPGMPPWCALDVCVEERHRCMREIGVEQVLQECRRLGEA
jgi:ADP-heptose:LPS heptosyltransferase